MKKPKKNSPKRPSLPEKRNDSFEWKNWFQLAAVLTVVFFIYSPTLNKEFLNYDDDWYVYNNPFVSPFNSGNIGKIFSSFYYGQYSPLPMTFLGILNLVAGNAPFLYNLSAVLLHLICVCLVCWLVFRLCKNPLAAIAASLLFGLCPLNAESIAWASAAFKTCFYTIFFLSALITYTFYVSSGKMKYLALTLVFFVLSFLSKEQAVALVLSLLCIDFYKGRNLLSKKVILEKIPFLVLSLAFGILTLMATKSKLDALIYSHFTFPERILYACYALGEYFFKLFIPYELSAHYPYPESKDFSAWFYLHPLIIAGLVFLIIRSARNYSKGENHQPLYDRSIAFGILFFISNILFTLVLQVVSVREAVMADRYVYVSSIGIIFLATEQLRMLWSKKSKWVATVLFTAFAVFFSVASYSRCAAWKNSFTLWDDVISHYQNIPLAYIGRGNELKKKNKLNEAMSDYSKAIELKPTYIEAFINRGNLLRDINKPDEALKDYNKVIELNPRYAIAYYDRGNFFMNAGRYDEALSDYNKALELQPDFPDVYYNRGNLFSSQKKYEAAIADFNKLIELKPKHMEAFANRGTAFAGEKKYDEAIRDFSKAIMLRPDYPDSYCNRGIAEYYSDKKEDACNDFRKAASLGYQPAEGLLLRFCK